MSNAQSFTISSEQEAQQIARQAAAPQPQDPMMGWRPAAEIAQRHEVTINQGGEITSANSTTRVSGHNTFTISQPRPGFVDVPGMGETTVEAAKAAGLIPRTWQEGDALPFDGPAKAAQKGTEAGTREGTENADDEGDKKELSVAEHRAKVAGEILDNVDKALGAAVTDAMIERAVETGELPLDMLPKGFTETQMKQVEQGYIAQADSVLAPVGASVTMLQEFLDEGELLQARRYTLAGSKDDLADLGRKAVDRLATLPKTDHEGFLSMLSDMPQRERQCIRQDSKTGEYRVTVPGHPEMSFGAAVRLGLVRV